MINSIQFQGLSISSMSSFLKRIPVQKQYQSYLKKLNQNKQKKSQQTDVKKSVCNFLIVQPPIGLQNSEQNNQQKRLTNKEMDLNYDQKEYRLIRRRIDKQIKFDLFYYCLLEYFCNKKQAEKKRKEITLQKNHRSVVSLFVLFKLVVKQKKDSLDLDELREKVEKRIENKYQYCARNFRSLLTNQLEIIFSALELFLSQHEMEAIQKVYTSRQTNKNIISKMERCKEVISEEKKYQ